MLAQSDLVYFERTEGEILILNRISFVVYEYFCPKSIHMNYSTAFKNLILRDTKSGDFIGFGNPNSKILIIGKECALDLESDNHQDIFERSNKPNHAHWLANINNEHITPESVPTWKDAKIFNPLYPYKGDALSDLPRGNSTWRNYQKLINQLYPQATELTTFHQYCFITEFNDIPMNYSKSSPEVQRAVQNRCANILSHPFFKEFSVVIVACGHYVDKYDIDLQKLFDQVWDGETESIGKGEWINVHRNNGKLLLHTRQLSMCSNKLIGRLAELCTDYI